MHELTIAESILRQILALAEQHKGKAIHEVEITVGQMQLVVPEALETAFRAVSQDTIAQGARLIQTPEAIEAECRHCGRRYQVQEQDMQCPHCGQANAAIMAGMDIILKTVVMDQEEPIPS